MRDMTSKQFLDALARHGMKADGFMGYVNVEADTKKDGSGLRVCGRNGGSSRRAQLAYLIREKARWIEGEPERLRVALAARFSKLLWEDLGRLQMLKVIERNAAETDPKVCHSHDFCDANMVMAEAWKQTQGVELDTIGNEEHCARWNAAWSLAVRAAFDAKAIRERKVK